MTLDTIIQVLIGGFAAGVGSGLANWLLIKRLEKIEMRVINNVKNLKKNSSNKQRLQRYIR